MALTQENSCIGKQATRPLLGGGVCGATAETSIVADK